MAELYVSSFIHKRTVNLLCVVLQIVVWNCDVYQVMVLCLDDIDYNIAIRKV